MSVPQFILSSYLVIMYLCFSVLLSFLISFSCCPLTVLLKVAPSLFFCFFRLWCWEHTEKIPHVLYLVLSSIIWINVFITYRLRWAGLFVFRMQCLVSARSGENVTFLKQIPAECVQRLAVWFYVTFCWPDQEVNCSWKTILHDSLLLLLQGTVRCGIAVLGGFLKCRQNVYFS